MLLEAISKTSASGFIGGGGGGGQTPRNNKNTRPFHLV